MKYDVKLSDVKKIVDMSDKELVTYLFSIPEYGTIDYESKDSCVYFEFEENFDYKRVIENFTIKFSSDSIEQSYYVCVSRKYTPDKIRAEEEWQRWQKRYDANYKPRKR